VVVSALKDVHEVGTKIDGSFVSAVAVAGPDRAIIAAILSLGEEMGVTVIAEHIEDETPLQALRLMGCPLAQGHHFAPSSPAADLPLGGFDARGRPGVGDPSESASSCARSGIR